MKNKDKVKNMASCMLSILDSLKLYDNDSLLLDNETLSEIMFRKMDYYNINLNKELGFTHLKPISKNRLQFHFDCAVSTRPTWQKLLPAVYYFIKRVPAHPINTTTKQLLQVHARA